jgi:hypothetical protein
MPKFNEHQVKEINTIITSINDALEKSKNKKCQIGSRDKVTLQMLLKANKIEPKNTAFFKCKRDYCDTIVSYFINEKGLSKSKFSMNAQENIFLVF